MEKEPEKVLGDLMELTSNGNKGGARGELRRARPHLTGANQSSAAWSTTLAESSDTPILLRQRARSRARDVTVPRCTVIACGARKKKKGGNREREGKVASLGSKI